MPAQGCAIMYTIKTKSETRFGVHALALRFYSTTIYYSRLCCLMKISLLLNQSVKVSFDLLLRSTALIKSKVSDPTANLPDPTANSLID